ncbi:beta-ketoacyl-ACP synthase III [Lignipirellula cremea]|uniref:Beta-ketoacyl-[acyl-carrier-protein] synthase III n=1 Tax=Lignipirellula cremea TaxID=2528010 RepID=A0A518DQR8_9BACT|nr:beta-ketoacyl-ACP synthase III [Lignipirellula cremea]QDU94187.1 3-oxoacyl-[acyl-carrier-protein] synthase 3 [Lignipirellula cremea]
MATITPAPHLHAMTRPLGNASTRSLTGVAIAGVGSFAPALIVRNEDLGAQGYDADWILQRTGIKERRRAPDGMNTSDMGYEAAVRCLEAAECDPADVDLIVFATMTPDTPMPSTACHLQARMGIAAPAFDINAACSGFVYALVTGAQFVKSGGARNALVVGADLMSRVLNPADKITFPLFGDGAGAVLLRSGHKKQGLISYSLGADGQGAGLLCTPGGGTREPLSAAVLEGNRQYLQMEGKAVFKWAVRKVSESITQAALEAGRTPDEMDLLILHQANVRIIDAAIQDLGIDRDKVVINLDRYGNTSAGSIPLVLDEAQQAGRIAAGDLVLICGFGAGLTWGSAVIQW